MNVADIIILVCLVPFMIKGGIDGFIRQLTGIASLIIGAWASWKFSALVSGWIAKWMEASNQLINIISYIVIFVAVVVILYILGKMLEGIVKLVMLNWLNKLLGVIFATVKCFLVIGIIILIFTSLNNIFDIVSQDYLDEAMLYNPIKSLAENVFPFIKNYLIK